MIAEPTSLSGIPEYLRIAAKPLVDVILSGGDLATADRQKLLDQGAGLLARDINDIQSELGYCTCIKDGFLAEGDQPYASLLAKVPADEKGVSRRDLAAKGQGLLLSDLTEV